MAVERFRLTTEKQLEPEREVPEFVFTKFFGNIDRVILSNWCRVALHNNQSIDVDIETLLEFFDYFDHEYSGDSMKDSYANMRFYPIRVKVLKMLLAYPHEIEMEHFLLNSKHKALRLMLTAKKKSIEHEAKEVVLENPVRCACKNSMKQKHVFACSLCKTITCQRCSGNPCAALLQELILSEERNEELKKDDSGIQSSDLEDEEESEEDMECEHRDSDYETEMKTRQERVLAYVQSLR